MWLVWEKNKNKTFLEKGKYGVTGHLCYAKSPNIFTVWGGAVASTPGPGQQAAQSLDADAPVDGMFGRRGSPRQPGTGVVVSHGLYHGGDDPSQDAKHPCQTHGGKPPLACGWITTWKEMLRSRWHALRSYSGGKGIYVVLKYLYHTQMQREKKDWLW